jgi:DNA-binding transcriptional regulator YiaG
MKMKTFSRRAAGRTFSVEVPLHKAPDGVVEVHAGDALRAELEIAAQMALEGPIHGETFTFMRRSLGMYAKTLAELLDVRAESVSRWERGERAMDRAAWLLLADVVLERAGKGMPILELMERHRAGRRPARAGRAASR